MLYLNINGTEYTDLKDLAFSPEVDMSNDSLPINQLEVKIYTNDRIMFGQWLELLDDTLIEGRDSALWAEYWITFAERIGRDDDRNTYVVKVIAESLLTILDRITMPEKVYQGDITLDQMIAEIPIYNVYGGRTHTFYGDLGETPIYGYVPEQTARERLQWILLVGQAYIQNFFDRNLIIHPIPTTGAKVIPLEKTFWKPVVSYREYATAVKVHGRTYTRVEEEPTGGVFNYITYTYTLNGVTHTEYYVVTGSVVTITNPNAPADAPENIIEIDDCTIISESMAATVATYLAGYYFNRVTIEADVINNGEYLPGERVLVYTDEDQMYQGYINRCEFSFGVYTRSKLFITGAVDVPVVKLTIDYMWGNILVARRVHSLPKYYPYSISTEYIDFTMNGHRYIFRPSTDTVSGTLTGNITVTVTVEVALDNYTASDNTSTNIMLQCQTMWQWLDEFYQTLMGYEAMNGGDGIELQQEKTDNLNELLDTFTQLANVPNTASVLHIESVDGLETETETDSNDINVTYNIVYINGDHRN